MNAIAAIHRYRLVAHAHARTWSGTTLAPLAIHFYAAVTLARLASLSTGPASARALGWSVARWDGASSGSWRKRDGQKYTATLNVA